MLGGVSLKGKLVLVKSLAAFKLRIFLEFAANLHAFRLIKPLKYERIIKFRAELNLIRHSWSVATKDDQQATNYTLQEPARVLCKTLLIIA